MSKIRHQVNMLLLKIKDGDKSKMSDLFNLTYNHLKYIALHNLYNKSSYEDALSEMYYRILKHINSFNVFKDGYNWMCRIIQNIAIDMNKESSKYVLCEDVDTDVLNFSEEINQRLSEDLFYQIVKDFSQIDRQIIYYKYFWDLSYGQIAKKLKRAKSYVYNRIVILNEKIKKSFEKQ